MNDSAHYGGYDSSFADTTEDGNGYTYDANYPNTVVVDSNDVQ